MENEENFNSSTDQPETELSDEDTNEDHTAGATITAKGEHSRHTTGFNEHIQFMFTSVQLYILKLYTKQHILFFVKKEMKLSSIIQTESMHSTLICH